MELDILDVQFVLRNIKPRELEEALEDPFAVRLLSDNKRKDGASRYYALGRTVADRYLFLSFWTDGKPPESLLFGTDPVACLQSI